MKIEKYCIITTTIDDENIASQISTALLKESNKAVKMLEASIK